MRRSITLAAEFRTGRLGRALALASLSVLALACSEASPTNERLVTGKLEVIVVEGEHGGTRYYLLPDDATLDPIELRFDRAPNLGSGVHIGVDGRYEGDALRVSGFDFPGLDAEIPGKQVAPLNAVTPEATDTVAFVMVDYGQGVNVSEAEAQRFMFSTTNPGPTLGIGENDRSTLQFYDETSYGLFAVSGDVEGPLDWTGAAACNGSGGSQLANQLRNQISTEYGHYIWYYGSEQPECEYGWGSLGNWNNPSRDVWFNGGLFDGAITHEIGHNLGYQHASSIDCGSVPLANDPMDCDTNEYGSAVSIMGNTSNGHMMAIEKWYAGWFDGCNAVRVRTGGSFTLHPIESACDGIQTLQIPMPITTREFDTQQSNNPSPARFYYLEYRNGTGLDTGMTPSVIVVASDEIGPPNRPCARSVQLDMNPNTNPLNGMTAGQSFADPAGGVTFSVTSLTPEAAVINVELAATPMPNTCMDGSTLVGSGPESCGGGAAGAGGMGGAAGAAGTAGNGGVSGMGMAGMGMAGMVAAGAGGIAGAGAGGAGMGGNAGVSGAGAGGALAAGAGGMPAGSGGIAMAGTSGTPTAGAGGSSSGGVAGSGGATAGAPQGATGGAVSGAAGSVAASGATGTTQPVSTAEDAGCGCRVAGSSSRRPERSLWSLAALGLLAVRRRRATSARYSAANASPTVERL